MPSYLNPVQDKRAKKLSAALREAVRNADYGNAKLIFHDYHSLLHVFGDKSKTRLLKARLWVWEAAIEAREFQEARKGLSIVLDRLNENTRGYLETLKLLTVLEIRAGNIQLAGEHAKTVVQNITAIRTEKTRREFHEDFIDRIKQEVTIYLLREKQPKMMGHLFLKMKLGN